MEALYTSPSRNTSRHRNGGRSKTTCLRGFAPAIRRWRGQTGIGVSRSSRTMRARGRSTRVSRRRRRRRRLLAVVPPLPEQLLLTMVIPTSHPNLHHQITSRLLHLIHSYLVATTFSIQNTFLRYQSVHLLDPPLKIATFLILTVFLALESSTSSFHGSIHQGAKTSRPVAVSHAIRRPPKVGRGRQYNTR